MEKQKQKTNNEAIKPIPQNLAIPMFCSKKKYSILMHCEPEAYDDKESGIM